MDLKSDFTAFLATHAGHTWTNKKGRILKYLRSHNNTANVTDKVHPYVMNYDKSNYTSFMNLQASYLLCTFVRTQFSCYHQQILQLVKGLRTRCQI